MPEITVTCQPASREYVKLFLDSAAKRMDECWSVVNSRVGATFDALVELLDACAVGMHAERMIVGGTWPGYTSKPTGVCNQCGEAWPCPTERARDLLAAIRGEGSADER